VLRLIRQVACHAGRSLARAFPLVQLFSGTTTLDAWRRFGTELMRGRHGGVLGVHDPRGYLHGLCTFLPVPILDGGRGLRIANVVLVDLTDHGRLVTGLAGAIERLGDELAFDSIAIELPVHGAADGFADRFRSGLSDSWQARFSIYSSH
jgi:hypothetical protein